MYTFQMSLMRHIQILPNSLCKGASSLSPQYETTAPRMPRGKPGSTSPMSNAGPCDSFNRRSQNKTNTNMDGHGWDSDVTIPNGFMYLKCLYSFNFGY